MDIQELSDGRSISSKELLEKQIRLQAQMMLIGQDGTTSRSRFGLANNLNGKLLQAVVERKAPAVQAQQMRTIICQTCKDTGEAEYNMQTGRIRYCSDCDFGRSQAAEAERFYAEMRAERQAHLRKVNQGSIDAFTKRHNVALAQLPKGLQQFVDGWDGSRGILLLGPYGVGKTWRVVALAQTLLERSLREEWTMKLTTVPGFLNELRAGYDPERQKQSESFYSVMQQYRTVRLLVLDDWGKEKPTAWVSEQFYELVNHRYNQGLPMFLTSNLTKEQLEKDFPAEMDRFNEICQVIEITGDSLRKQGGK